MLYPSTGGGGSMVGFIVVSPFGPVLPLQRMKTVDEISAAIRKITIREVNIFLFMKLIFLFDKII